ncbi:MAG: hypothetical protein V3T86_04885 [Planctomycetota bacterium]
MILLSNVMIPTVAGHVVLMLGLLIPVALVEAIVIARRHDLQVWQSFGLAMGANLKSTIIGIPLGYLFAVLGLIPSGLFTRFVPEAVQPIISVTLFHAVAYGGKVPSELDRMGLLLGTLLVMIPYYLVTIRVERKYLEQKLEDDPSVLRSTVRIMNAITYGLLAVPVVVGAVLELVRLAE